MTDIQPGWYRDPAEPSTQRYWDGDGWIGEAISADVDPPTGPPDLVEKTPIPTITPEDRALANRAIANLAEHPPNGAPVFLHPGGNPNYLYTHPRPHGYSLAPISARFVARVIDIIAVFGLNILVNGWFVFQYVKELMPIIDDIQQSVTNGEPTKSVDVPARAGWLQIAILMIATLLWFAYEVPAIANNGQTIGKRIMHIRVMRLENQKPLGLRRAWRRWRPLGLPSLLWGCYGFGFLLQGLDLIVGIFDRPLHQTMHDKSVNTVVVNIDQYLPTPQSSSSQNPDEEQQP